MGKRAATALLSLSLGLTVALVGPAVLAQMPTAPTATDGDSDRTTPPPPPGDHRLIRLGPQALVFEDDQGNISMVDEKQPELTRGQAIGAAFGALGGGVAGVILREPRAIPAGTIYGAGDVLEDVRPSPTVRPKPTRSPP